MHPDLHPCAHPGCTRHALRGSATCGAHAGEGDLPSPPAWPAGDEQYPYAGAFDLVIALRDSLHRYLCGDCFVACACSARTGSSQ